MAFGLLAASGLVDRAWAPCSACSIYSDCHFAAQQLGAVVSNCAKVQGALPHGLKSSITVAIGVFQAGVS